MNQATLFENRAAVYPAAAFNDSLFERFIAYTDVKETTLQGYMVCIRQFAKWLQESGIKQPAREDIKAYKAFLDSNDKYAAGTKAQYFRAVKHFFKWTASEGLYPNIADNLKGAKIRQGYTAKEAFTADDMKAILDNIGRETEAGKRNYAMILLSVVGGLRIIEMQRANIEDIQTVRGERILYIQGKGRDAKDEYTKLPPEVDGAIMEYLESRPAYKKNDPLFTGTGNRAKGERLTEPSISRIIKTAFKEAGYDSSRLTAHSLRHTAITLLFEAGHDLTGVQKYARHANPQTTERYMHRVNRDKDKSEEIIYNSIFNPAAADPAQMITDMLQDMTTDEAQKILAFMMQMQEEKEAYAKLGT